MLNIDLALKKGYKRNIIIGSVILAIVFSLGVIIGHFGRKIPKPEKTKAEALVNTLMSDQFSNEKDLIKEALENVDSNNLRLYLKELTRGPHIAGHRRDNELIEYIQKTWTDIGLDRVELTEYDFYLSWPNQVLKDFLS